MSTVDSSGITIGLVNYVGVKDAYAFCKHMFADTLLDKYRERVEKNGNGSLLPKELFKAKFYRMTGENNVMFLVAVDDFTFVNRSLHPGHIVKVDSDADSGAENFRVHLINGIHMLHDGCNTAGFTLAEKLQRISEKEYPLIGLVCLKVNNGLLLGTGLALVERVKEKIENLFRAGEVGLPESIDVIVINSFSNFEVTVLVFARRVDDIVRFVESVRKLRAESLFDSNEKGDTLFESSLIHRIMEDDDYVRVNDAHVFSSTVTRIGYDAQTEVKDINDRMNFQVDFELRTGHCDVFKHKVEGWLAEREGLQDYRFSIVPGAYTFRLNLIGATFGDVAELETYIKDEDYVHHVRTERVKVVLPYDDKIADDTWEWSEMHPSLRDVICKMRISEENIKNLNENLTLLGVSKVLRERFLKAMFTFNACVTDVTYFPYFIELRGFLQDMCHRVGCLAKEVPPRSVDNQALHQWIYNKISYYERAYFNRFHHSSKILGATDSNLEYNGGVQQMISAYDFSYKVIMERVGKDYRDIDNAYLSSMLYVSGYENVQSDSNTLKVDITHFTSPELYATIVWKEALNFYFERMGKEGVVDGKGVTGMIKSDDPRLSLSDLLRPGDEFEHFRDLVALNGSINRRRRAQDILLDMLDVSLVQYFAVDYYVFQNGFAGDLALFTDCYWHYFMQMSHKYDRLDRPVINERSFVIFMARWLLVVELHRIQSKGKTSQEVDTACPYDVSIGEMWAMHHADVSVFVAVVIGVLQRTKAIEGLLTQGSKFLKEAFSSEEDTGDDVDISRRVRRLCNRCTESLAKGKVVDFREEKESLMAYVLYLGYGLLKGVDGLKYKKVQDRFCAKVVERNSEGGVVKRVDMSGIMADSLGGVFVYDNSVRGDYFRLRMAYQSSLWDMAMSFKAEQVVSCLKQEGV